MAKIINVLDCGKSVCTISSDELTEIMGGSDGAMVNEYLRRDLDNMLEYFEKNSPDKDKITVDMQTLLDGNNLDAAKTNGVFWLSAVLMKKGMLRKMSPVTAMKLVPLIAAKTKAAQLNSKRAGKDIDLLLKFSRTYTDCNNRIAKDEMTADSAAEELYKVLPPEKLVRSEAKVRPQIKDILMGVRKIGDACADVGIKNKIDAYMKNIDDIF